MFVNMYHLGNWELKGKGRGKGEDLRGLLWVVREEEEVLSNHSSDPALLHQLLMNLKKFSHHRLCRRRASKTPPLHSLGIRVYHRHESSARHYSVSTLTSALLL